MFDDIGAQMVLACSIIGLVIVLYVVTSVSFCFPHLVEVSVLIMFIVLFAFSLVILMCSPKLSLGSNVRPRIFGFLTVGIDALLMLRFNVLLYSEGSVEKSVES